MERGRWWAAAGAVVAAVWSGVAGAEEPLQERLERLEQRQAALERKYEVDQGTAANRAESLANATANGKDGFTLKSPDGDFTLRLTGYAQADYRAFLGDEPHVLTDQFLLRRVRPSFAGTVNKYADFRVMPDFGGGTTVLQDAYLDLKYRPQARLRAGKFTVPAGLERLQSSTAIFFVERAYPSSLAPNRDVGIQLHGEFRSGVLGYALGVFNGVADGGSADADTADSKDFAARVFLQPFKHGNSTALKEFGIGAAASAGRHRGTAASPGLASYRTPGQNVFFSYRSDVTADGARVRVSPQAYWYPGRLGFLGEYITSSQDVRRVAVTTTTASLTNTAWQAAASYVLTGENASYKGVKPKNDFDPAKGTWGAWELTARYSELAADPDAFARYANPATAAQRARSWTGGFNWYLNAGVKVTSDYEYTRFTGGAAAGDRPGERAILSRFQVAF